MTCITVIIPAFNCATTIARALDSVEKLETGNWKLESRDIEVIVIDDGSSDGTAGVVKSYQLSVNGYRLRLIVLDQNSGPAAARNRGIREAKGEWIAFLDADDAWLPEKLEIQTKLAAEHPEVAMWCGGAVGDETRNAEGGTGKAEGGREERETSNIQHPTSNVQLGGGGMEESCHKRSQSSPLAATNNRQLITDNYRQIPLAEFACCNPVATSTVLVKKAAVEAAGGFDESFRGPEDYDLWLRIAARSPVGMIAAPLARHTRTPGSLSMDDRTFLPQVLRVLDKAYGEGGVLSGRRGRRRARAYQYLCAAWSASTRGAGGTALGLFARAFAECPWISGHPYVGPLSRLKLLWKVLRDG